MSTEKKSRLQFILGVAICFAVAAVSVLLERLIPGDVLGASIIALFMGTIINSFFHPSWIKPALKFTSKKVLKIAIIPTVLVFAYIGVRMKKKALQAQTGSQKVNIVKIVPWFITGFLALAIINSIGLIPVGVSAVIKAASKFLMVTALAAIGLSTSLVDFKKAGLAPMFYGITIDTLVTLTALAVIWCMGLM